MATGKLLNFGHTLGHAIENMYALPHGQAVAIGMVAACRISEQLTGFKQTESVVALLSKYGLPVHIEFDKAKAFDILQKDKKKVKDCHELCAAGEDRKGWSIPLKELEKIILVDKIQGHSIKIRLENLFFINEMHLNSYRTY